MTLSELRKSLFGDAKMLTEDEVRRLMQAHAEAMAQGTNRKSSGRKAAISLGINTTYWSQVLKGKQHPGPKIFKAYGLLPPVKMYEVVEVSEEQG